MAKEHFLSKRDIQSLDVAKLYYQSGKSQQEIAAIMGLSRPTIAKLLQHAQDLGFVQIRICDPREHTDELAERIQERYRLDEVRLIPSPPEHDLDRLRQELGKAAARMLEKLVRDGDCIGIEWSNTIQAMAKALVRQNRKQVKVVQLRGSDTQMQQNLNEAQSIHRICPAFQAEGETLNLPCVFDQLHTKNLMEKENPIRRVLESGKQCRIAVFTVGAAEADSPLFSSGLFSDTEIAHLLQHAVGSICARFVNREGQICLPDLNNRTIGIRLPDLRHKEERLLIAGGSHKAAAIHTTLKYGYANRLVSDERTARHIMQHNSSAGIAL